MEGKTTLWYPYITSGGVMVVTDTSLQGKPVCKFLTEVHIPCYFILVQFIYQIAVFILYQIGFLSTGLRFVPCRASEALPVYTEGDAVPLKEGGTLVPADATDVVIVLIEIGFRISPGIIAIVYLVVTPVVVNTEGTVGVTVVVR